MMVANSANMIITVKPANQNNNIQRRPIAPGKATGMAAIRSNSPVLSTSHRSAVNAGETNLALVENDDEDEVTEYVQGSSGDTVGDPGFPRAAWGSQELQTGSVASKMSTAIPQTSVSDVETLTDNVRERLNNGVSVMEDDKSASQHDQDKNVPAGGSAAKIPSPHESLTKSSASDDSDEIVEADELNLVSKNASSKPSSEGAGKHSSNVRVVFTPIEDL